MKAIYREGITLEYRPATERFLAYGTAGDEVVRLAGIKRDEGFPAVIEKRQFYRVMKKLIEAGYSVAIEEQR